VSSILLRSLFYRDGELIISHVSQVSGADDVVDAGIGIINDDLVAMYLGYNSV
jgi:thiazole synthase ThiGH ThiG subunit